MLFSVETPRSAHTEFLLEAGFKLVAGTSIDFEEAQWHLLAGAPVHEATSVRVGLVAEPGWLYMSAQNVHATPCLPLGRYPRFRALNAGAERWWSTMYIRHWNKCDEVRLHAGHLLCHTTFDNEEAFGAGPLEALWHCCEALSRCEKLRGQFTRLPYARTLSPIWEPTPLIQRAVLTHWSEEMLARTIIGEPILFYRTAAGKAVALTDRCPHRMLPLSMGKRVGDGVQCAYHGLQFDCSGKCVVNPHSDGPIPVKLATKSYPVVERHNLIWLWMGDPAEADPSTIPDHSCLEHPELGNVCGLIEMKANYQLITDNLLDLTHVAYLHEGLLGSDAIVGNQHEIQQKGTTVYSNHWCPDGLPPPAWSMAFDGYDKPVDHWMYMRWDAPAHLLLDVGVTPVGRPRTEGIWVYATSILTPKDAETTYYFWGVSRWTRLNDPEADAFWGGSVTLAFDGQDKPVIEAQQRNLNGKDIDSYGPVLLPTDGGAVRARRVLADLISKQAEGARPRPGNLSLEELRRTRSENVNPIAPCV